jgi:hypothetical protein
MTAPCCRFCYSLHLQRLERPAPVRRAPVENRLAQVRACVSVAESAHNLTLYVPEIVLLGCVGTRQLVYFLMGRHGDPLLA